MVAPETITRRHSWSPTDRPPFPTKFPRYKQRHIYIFSYIKQAKLALCYNNSKTCTLTARHSHNALVRPPRRAASSFCFVFSCSAVRVHADGWPLTVQLRPEAAQPPHTRSVRCETPPRRNRMSGLYVAPAPACSPAARESRALARRGQEPL